jgi:uncharacterized protein (TIGR03032 family)
MIVNIRFFDNDSRRDIQGKWWADPTRDAVVYDGMVVWKNAKLDADCSHVNGAAIQDDRLVYVTAVSNSRLAHEWRQKTENGGVVFDVEGKVILGGLSMPHSPRIYGDDLLFCESGYGALRSLEHGFIAELPGFTRGLLIAGDTAFVGLSAMRYDDDFTRNLPLRGWVPEPVCGIAEVDIATGDYSVTPILNETEILDIY